ncbi:MAG: hypothetical protein IV100_33110 [Myxococcales bacterium]|nr:hypothetical protein [Myxococcales bacterium]
MSVLAVFSPSRISSFAMLIVLSTGVPTSLALAAAPETVQYPFSLEIVSGSREGERSTGTVSVPRASMPRGGSGTVEASAFTLNYAGRKLTEANLDGPAQVRFDRGRPVELIAVGGPQELRFGFTAGFSREQFCRSEEEFIRRGQPYFGYLDPETYVDGAGVVSFGRSAARGDIAGGRE